MTSRRATPELIAILAFLGVLLGLVGSVVSAARLVVGGVTVPWGLVLVSLTLGVAVRAVLWSTASRLAGGVLLGGWFAATVAVLLLSPGQDVLLPDVPRTYAYLLSAAFLGLLALVWRLPPGLPDLLDADDLPAEDVPSPSEEPDGVR